MRQMPDGGGIVIALFLSLIFWAIVAILWIF